jgi:hypothetical protein
VEIDLRNSQFLFLALLLKENGIPATKYCQLAESGKLYDYLAGRAGVSRPEAKGGLITALYAKNGFTSPIKTLFGKEFPEVAKFPGFIFNSIPP